MQNAQLQIDSLSALTAERLAPLSALAPQLVLVFAASAYFRDSTFSNTLSQHFPGAQIVGCSSAGEISSQGSYDDNALISALHFDHPSFNVVSGNLTDMEDSEAAGVRLGTQLLAACTTAPHTVLVFAPGTNINGSSLIAGLQSAMPQANIAGGLAGDGANFVETYTLHQNNVDPKQIVVIGFSGEHIQAGFGSYGGWKPFGPVRKVTKATHNVLFELDNEPALAVYKRYLGEHAAQLPASGLLFPFSMLNENREEVGLIRTILAVDEDAGSLTLAGDVFNEGFLQLMHATTDSLVEGAATAAEAANLAGNGQGFALLVSCIGRKLVMGGRTDEEVDAVSDVLGQQHTYAGFHSYGEISPGHQKIGCDLYNQTMTVTFLREV